MNDYLSMIEAAKALPGRPHVNTVRRWMRDGVSGIKLRSFKMGSRGGRFTTQRWVDEFLLAIAAREDLQAHAEAEAKLDALGV